MSDIISVDDQNFKSEVRNYKGFVLVDFWAEWCRPCKSLMPRIDQLAQDKEGKIKICKFNVDEGVDVPGEYGVQSIPTLIIFQDGKEIARKVGAINDLSSWVSSKIS
ncbi:thioredoxin [Wolbachia endosymbiont of Dipetalonema caudispina]|uniref:thioredoxin n=1 Tax=Wolbachia endosymbiont of Dipetalonema caudispina TaxID=1812112 RepID=UPI0015896580|nr:thioredoxin [Wolbachia endosymbiont of Dipetalonema caudispina]MCV3769308.1 thioredoxin [Wolbachia pipientis]QKX00860.1 thioredoxin [Wolbachia endosymbiont of Dipetalonema caudispina]